MEERGSQLDGGPGKSNLLNQKPRHSEGDGGGGTGVLAFHDLLSSFRGFRGCVIIL